MGRGNAWPHGSMHAFHIQVAHITGGTYMWHVYNTVLCALVVNSCGLCYGSCLELLRPVPWAICECIISAMHIRHHLIYMRHVNSVSCCAGHDAGKRKKRGGQKDTTTEGGRSNATAAGAGADYNPPCIKCNGKFKCLDDLMVHEAKCLDGDQTVPCFEGTYVPWDGDEHYIPCYAGTFIPFFN